MFQCALLRDVAAAGADDHRQFALVVQLFGNIRADDGCAVADQGGGEAREEGGVGGLFVGAFLRVVGIVKADADDLARTLDGRKVADRIAVDDAGRAQCAVGGLQRRLAGLEQIVQRTGIVRLVFAQATQRALDLDRQPLVGTFKELHETHDEYLCCSCDWHWYGTLPYPFGEICTRSQASSSLEKDI
ncbi:hypothetical protein FQZ97_985340 [compost metagenome]